MQDNDILMWPTHTEGMSIDSENFRNCKNCKNFEE